MKKIILGIFVLMVVIFTLSACSGKKAYEFINEESEISKSKEINIFFISSPPFWFYYITVFGIFQDPRGKEVKYSADAECEIISLRKLWNISLRSTWNEIRPSHLRSKYFTAKLFHLGVAKFHSPQANFVEKSTSALQMCFFLSLEYEKAVKPVISPSAKIRSLAAGERAPRRLRGETEPDSARGARRAWSDSWMAFPKGKALRMQCLSFWRRHPESDRG